MIQVCRIGYMYTYFRNKVFYNYFDFLVFPGATVQVDDPQHQVMRTPPMKAELDTLNAPSSNYHKSSHEVIDTIR